MVKNIRLNDDSACAWMSLFVDLVQNQPPKRLLDGTAGTPSAGAKARAKQPENSTPEQPAGEPA